MTDNSDSLAPASDNDKRPDPDKSRRVNPIVHFGQRADDTFMDFRPRIIEGPTPNYDADFEEDLDSARGLEDVQLPEGVKADLEEGTSPEGESTEIPVAPKEESVPEPAASQASQQTPVQTESETTAPAPAASETTSSKATSTQKQRVKPTVSGSRSSSSGQKSG